MIQDKENILMLETEKLDELFSLLKEMTLPGISHLKFAPKVEPALIWSPLGVFSPLIFSSILLPARWQHLGMTPSELHNELLNVERLFLVILCVSLTIFILALFYIVWHHKQFFPYLSHPVNDPQRDAKFTTELLRFNKATLAYGLLKYRRRWSSRDDRLAILTGDLRKVGLFQALVALLALFISAVAIFSKEDSSNPLLFFIWDFAVVLGIFYMMAIYNLVSRERPQQVIELLEYTIQHAEQCDGTQPDPMPITSAPSV
ncbi:hypothetical protein [Nitrosospira sp. Is2]|uniref:hypothetical protein n=1 Tax=Nitrosospira sp. Is2 TaxID=3080532 RepID=UPI00295507E0|nr:hypothetical protein [Nitrosospira sp. Is2]WON74778.1 hypothetical protein R5L00_04635 [Nitrosospira sp. Is2]